MQFAENVYVDRTINPEIDPGALFFVKTLTKRGRVCMALILEGEEKDTIMGEFAGWYYDVLLKYIKTHKPIWAIGRSIGRKLYYIEQKISKMSSYRGGILIMWENRYIYKNFGGTFVYMISYSGKVKSIKASESYSYGEISRFSKKEGFLFSFCECGDNKLLGAFSPREVRSNAAFTRRFVEYGTRIARDKMRALPAIYIVAAKRT